MTKSAETPIVPGASCDLRMTGGDVPSDTRRERRKSVNPDYLWHVDFHRQVANEQLAFMLISFYPVYRRDTALERVKQVLVKQGVLSYAIWELIGTDDILLQAWLPHLGSTDSFMKNLMEVATVEALDMTVQTIISHWMWHEDVSPAEFQTVNPAHYITLNGPSQKSIPGREITRYIYKRYIHRLPRERTYKFFIRLTNTTKSFNKDQLDSVVHKCRDLIASPRVSNASLMRISGQGGLYLISGRLKRDDLEALSELIDDLYSDGLLAALNIKSITHISSRCGPVDRREQLLADVNSDLQQAPDSELLDTLLLQPEGDELEFKSSCFKDIDFLAGKRLEKQTEEARFRDIAKAVCGMLNTRGGLVVVGVAEADHYDLDQMRSIVDEVEVIGDRYVIAVNHEYGQRGGWDAYERKVVSQIRKMIEGSTDGWVEVHRVLWKGRHNRALCVIKVRRPPTWYWLVDKSKTGGQPRKVFYGRQGGQTNEYSGSNMDDFRGAHPRLRAALE